MSDHRGPHRLAARAARKRRAWRQAEAIAAEQLRQADQRGRDLALLGRVAATANTAESSDAAYRRVLMALRRHAGFAVGHVWVAGTDGSLSSAGIWGAAPDAGAFLREVQAATRARRLIPPEGLPGEVAAAHAPVWLPDVSQAANVPRRAEAAIGSAFAFPVLSGDEVVAVIELLDPVPRGPDESLLGLAGDIGVQLGCVVERERARDRDTRDKEWLEARVSERTRAVLEARDAAEVANRAKGAFLAHVSHELRTPLHTVVGALEQARRDPAAADQVAAAAAAADHLAGIVDRLLLIVDAAHAGVGRVGSVDLSPLIDALPSRYADAAGNERVVARVAPGAPAVVTVNEALLLRAVDSLVDNALRYTAGAVRVDAGVRSGQLDIRVQDDGPGIDSEALPLLLEPLRVVPASAGHPVAGFGLGLPFAARAAEAMGGGLDITSRAWGTTARIWVSVGSDGREPRPGGSRRVLMADDNPANRRLTLGLLRRLGLEVDEAADGQQVLDAASDRVYGLILMDVRMPRLDGREATRRLRRASGLATPADVPVLAVTAQTGSGEREACLAAGMDDYLSKPFGLEELRAATTRWLGDHSAERASSR